MSQVIGYLKHTVDREIVHKRNPSGRLDLTVFSDSSWGDNHPIDKAVLLIINTNPVIDF